VPKRYWARLRVDVDCPLRRGAWYPVERLRPTQVTLEVLGATVSVARQSLDIVSAPPRRWSVVPRPKNPGLFPGVVRYGVCPNCRARVPLTEQPVILRCTRCDEVFDIAWEEQYFLSG